MKRDYKTECWTIVDNGLFVEWAVHLAKFVGKVNYYSPWEGPFPKRNQLRIGEGLPGVTRINDYHSVIDETDRWIFPDICYGGFQEHLDSLGKKVWGSRTGDNLENDREISKKIFKKMGLEVGNYEVIVGVDSLRRYLKDNDKQWIKTSLTRGDFESFFAKNYKLIEPKIDQIEHILGIGKKTQRFICEDDIPDAVEVGYDGYSVNGEFPNSSLIGIEVKCASYIGHFRKEREIPKQITNINYKIAGLLEDVNYRNFIAVEARITRDGVAHIIDPCMRLGSPPNEVILQEYTNLPDIIAYGTEGICVDPIPKGKWAVELCLKSSWAEKECQAIHFPEEIREHVKLKCLTKEKDNYYIVPLPVVGLGTIGAVVDTGDDLAETIERVKGYAEQVEGFYLEKDMSALDAAQEEIDKLKDFGIEL